MIVGCLMAAPLALIACGDNGKSEPDVDARPAPGMPDAGALDASVCPDAEDLWEDVDIASFTALAALDALDIAGDVTLAEAADYWELRRSAVGATEFTVVLSTGEKCATAADPAACETEFDELSATEGFGPACVEEEQDCFQYIALNRGDTNEIITSSEDLVTFLGDIDTRTEAAMVAYSHEYEWGINGDQEPAAGGVREVEGGGYELLVTELVQTCEPVVRDRVLLNVATDGEITDTRRQIYSAACNECL
jgi:hypothetical protein